MIYCNNCLQPDSRPNTQFTAGLCPACIFATQKEMFGWNLRVQEIKTVIAPYVSDAKDEPYDAILGVSGGKDSTKLALWARDFLKLRILLVVISYPPEQLTYRGARNLANLANKGFDIYTVAPSPGIWRELMKRGFVEGGNWGRSTEMALFAGVPRIAIQEKIKLILWGENPGLQLGDLATLGRAGWDGNNLKKMNTLASVSSDWLYKSGIDKRSLRPYEYPSEEEFEKIGRAHV